MRDVDTFRPSVRHTPVLCRNAAKRAWHRLFIHFISFHLFAGNIAIYKADTVILGCRSPQGNNLLRGAYRKNKVKNKK